MQILMSRAMPLVVLALCVLAYIGSLAGGFLFDDFNNIVNNPALRSIADSGQHWLTVALSSGSGLLRRPLSMLSFGLDVSLFGMDARAFRIVNLVLHLANGVLVYLLGRLLSARLIGTCRARPEWVAGFVAACWLLHPLLVSNVAYIVQRMNLLASLFTLAGLLCYAIGRTRMLEGGKGLPLAWAGLCGFGVLATLSKENGVLIVAYAWVIEMVCFRFKAATPERQRPIKGFFWVTLALPLAAFAIWLALHPDWLTARYANRDFTAYQRLLTEARILCDYLLWILVPNPTWMGLHHDDIAFSTGLLQPPSTLLSIAFLVAMVVAAWRLRMKLPGLAFGIAWFLAGHSMESSFLSLELVFEHRNYLPMAGLLLGLTCAVAPWLAIHLKPTAVAALAAGMVLGCAWLTASRAAAWGNPFDFAMTEAANHPQSSRAQYEAGRAIIIDGVNRGDRTAAETRALPYLGRSAELDPQQIAPLTEQLLIEVQRAPVPETTIGELERRLQRVPHYTKANSFLGMLVSLSLHPGSLKHDELARLVDVALANPRFPRKFRAMILNNYGAYQFNVVRDREAALRLTRDAAALQPKNPYFEINLAQIALASGDPQMAMEHLLKAAKLDVAGTHSGTIASLRRQLGGIAPDNR